MKISIVIPNYNGEKLLKKNLPKVFEAAENYSSNINSEVEVVIVDDASSDNSIDIIKNFKLKILQNEKNLGFSSTVNRGVKNSKGDIVVLLNTDVYPQKDFLKSLIEHFKNPEIFAVGSLDKSIEGGKVVLRGRGIGHWEKGFLVHSRGEVDKNNSLWASGGSSAFRKKIWDRLKGFNPLYNPFYWEDIDLCYRALKSGYKVLFERRSIVYHEHQKGAIKSHYSAFAIKTISFRNQFIFVWANATDLDLQFKHLIFLPYHFLKAGIRGDLAFLFGFFSALVLLPKIIKSSFESQKNFKLSDKETVKDFLK